MKKVAVIGAGFSGLSAASYLAKAGYDVTIFEKNSTAGGRARQIVTDTGYVFDMGPSWYWLPDVFEKFFADFGHKVADFYELKLLDPSFDIVYANNDLLPIPYSFEKLAETFESIEEGSANQLRKFMDEAEKKYNYSMSDLVYKPGLSIMEFAKIELGVEAFRLKIFSSFKKLVQKHFSNQKLRALMEFPILFLGAMPEDTPALYSFMNYAGLKLGTYYPMGGFGKIVDAMVKIALEQGVKIQYNATVESYSIEQNKINNIKVNGQNLAFDYVIAAADYHHAEQQLLPIQYRRYDEKYWNSRTFAPSCLLFYLGVKKRISNLSHHTLFFDYDLAAHAQQIYKKPEWPDKPLFYVCCPSKTDNTVAPEGHENIFLLMPIAPGLKDTEEMREKYYHAIMDRLEMQIGEDIRNYIDYKKSYCVNDFVSDYNAYKGNAYGLANTLSQTAIFKPKINNKKVKNLLYTGQLTIPGPGVPPSLISGKIVATHLQKISNNL